jgi:type VI secretion system VasD/TssJ family lipoprotein
MRKIVLHFLTGICIVMLLSGCGGSTPPDPIRSMPQWTFSPGAVKLRYKADRRLNEFDGASHTLSMCVYQLSAANGFMTLKKTPEGLLKLLECKNFDPTVVAYERIYVQPGEDKVVFLDRVEKATSLAVAAGFNQLVPEMSTRLFEYPVVESTEGFFTTTTVRQPGQIFVNIFLGPTSIQKVGGN